MDGIDPMVCEGGLVRSGTLKVVSEVVGEGAGAEEGTGGGGVAAVGETASVGGFVGDGAEGPLVSSSLVEPGALVCRGEGEVEGSGVGDCVWLSGEGLSVPCLKTHSCWPGIN